MAPTVKTRRRRTRRPDLIHKPNGGIAPRVQKVGPEHFGIVSVDCAKARSKWMLADFYGNVIVPPECVEHDQRGFANAVKKLRRETAAHGIKDLLVAVERTGRYHHPPQRAFAAAGFEARTVHPLCTKHFRQPADPGTKTDDTDLHAIHRAAVNGFALIDPQVDPFWRELQLLTRHRRDLVGKASILCCQIKEHLEAAMPGYAACFPTLWEHPAALHLAWKIGSAAAMRQTGQETMGQMLRIAGIRFQRRTLEHVLTWAANAADPDVAAWQHRRIAESLDEDRMRKEAQIQGLQRQIAASLVRTPYLLLLSIPGINVVSAAEYAGEMGPIGNYANSRCITGRAGLYPSRYQSDQVDRADGPLVKAANRRLRFAILQIADNLIKCNHHFGSLAARWSAMGKNPRDNRVRVGMRFCRISFQMVGGSRVFHHPAVQGRDYILRKLVLFHGENHTPAEAMIADLHAAVEQLPRPEHAAEAAALRQQCPATARGGARRLGDILAEVFLRLAGTVVQSQQSGNH
jgi:transposase